MHPSIYRRPKTIAEAKRMFADAESAAFLSGGHTLLPAMKLRLASPSDVIDLGAIDELQGITPPETTAPETTEATTEATTESTTESTTA